MREFPAASTQQAIYAAQASGKLPHLSDELVFKHWLPIAQLLAQVLCVKERSGPAILAVSGTPGTGKSTLSGYLSLLLESEHALRTAVFSIDDLYLSQKERARLAKEKHPLFQIRGAPGTHHINSGLELINALKNANEQSQTALPRFNKATDNPHPKSEWPLFIGRPDLIIIDSWFWNIAPCSEHDLIEPMNSREEKEDPDAAWRRAANRALCESYPAFFASAHHWIHLQSPSWEATLRWREKQELQLLSSRESIAGPKDARLSGLRGFLDLFKRWATLPQTKKPDLLLRLNEDHSIRAQEGRLDKNRQP